MRYPKLKVSQQKRVMIDSFRGYEHTPAVSAGAFYDMKNLSGERAPLLCVRGQRTPITELDGSPADMVNAVGGQGTAVVLDNDGTLWCAGAALPYLLDGNAYVYAEDENSLPVTITDQAAVLRAVVRPGSWRFSYNAATDRWTPLNGANSMAGGLLVPDTLDDGLTVTVEHSYIPTKYEPRELVFLGGWVCVFPDGKFANTAKLRTGAVMLPNVDYGDIAQSNECQLGGTVFVPCGPNGEELDTVWSDTPPAQGYWVDTSEPEATLRIWSQSQGLWVETNPYVKCSIPGIAKGLRTGDSVDLFCRLETNQGPEPLLEALWRGTRTLAGVWHDPGAENREEGRNDYVIIPGTLREACELELTWHDRSCFSVTRSIPKMDFVVSAGNRLWGCYCANGVNELYGSKLGDFRNWNCFEGLSTDSYRVSRGHSGPYTGAAVLGGCPLFFRADCLEKIFPAAGGDHGVVTVSLEGIEAGSAKSAVVIREKLYYKSEGGVCCYNGTLPVRISRALGNVSYHDAIAGARGSRYYINMKDQDGGYHLFVYNTETGFWYREDDCYFLAAYRAGERLYLLPRLGTPLLCVDGSSGSRNVDWWAETGDLLPRMALRRYVTRMQVTAQLDPGAELRVYLSYDGGPWLRKGELRGNRLKSVTFPVLARRCERLRLRLEGTGGMELHSLSWLTQAGSDV